MGKGSPWTICTDGGLCDDIGTIGVLINRIDLGKNILMEKSIEMCSHGHIDPTREELLAQLSAEIILENLIISRIRGSSEG